MPIHESITPDFLTEIDAEGPLVEEMTYGPLAQWPKGVFSRVFGEHLDPNQALWEETTVSRLLAEKWDRSYESDAGSDVNDRFHIDLCRVMVRARDAGRFNVEIPERSDYLAIALESLAQMDQSDPLAIEAASREQLGPFIREIGREFAELHLNGDAGRERLSALQAKALEVVSAETYPTAVRGALWAVLEFSGGYDGQVRLDEMNSLRAQ